MIRHSHRGIEAEQLASYGDVWLEHHLTRAHDLMTVAADAPEFLEMIEIHRKDHREHAEVYAARPDGSIDDWNRVADDIQDGYRVVVYERVGVRTAPPWRVCVSVDVIEEPGADQHTQIITISDAPPTDDIEELLADAMGPVPFAEFYLRPSCEECSTLATLPVGAASMAQIEAHVRRAHASQVLMD